MARQTDPNFYKGKRWQRERNIYIKEHPFCERCLAKGIYVPADIVHHKKYLNDTTAKDASIALNFDNLESLCATCHNNEHHAGKFRRKGRRWRFENGELIMQEAEEPPPMVICRL